MHLSNVSVQSVRPVSNGLHFITLFLLSRNLCLLCALKEHWEVTTSAKLSPVPPEADPCVEE